MGLRYMAISLMVFPALMGESSDGGIDERYYYRLTNSSANRTRSIARPMTDMYRLWLSPGIAPANSGNSLCSTAAATG